MRLNSIVSSVIGLAALAPAAVEAAVTIDVRVAVGPNLTSGSPSNAPFVSNALTALQTGAASVGTPGTPSHFQALANGTVVSPGAFTVTNFVSWNGNADPISTYGAGYANEYGSRLFYTLHIQGNGERFKISDLAFNGAYNSPTYPNYSIFSAPAGSYGYTADRFGLNYGDDNVKGTGDDFIVNSGAATQLVDELFSRGSTIGYAVLNDASFPGATLQEKIDNYNNYYWGGETFEMVGTYTLGSAQGSAFVVVPEPAALGILGAGAMLLLRRRRS